METNKQEQDLNDIFNQMISNYLNNNISKFKTFYHDVLNREQQERFYDHLLYTENFDLDEETVYEIVRLMLWE